MKLTILALLFFGIFAVNTNSEQQVESEPQVELELDVASGLELDSSLESEQRCFSACRFWTYAMGESYGCSMVNWTYETYRDRLNYYQNTCNCASYAAGIMEGYQNCSGPQGDPSNNDGNSNCTQWNPQTEQYETIEC